jgi:hypothetical protein
MRQALGDHTLAGVEVGEDVFLHARIVLALSPTLATDVGQPTC